LISSPWEVRLHNLTWLLNQRHLRWHTKLTTAIA